jgi:uncharacterized membrane protein YdfJ with MMPL/SSD domain
VPRYAPTIALAICVGLGLDYDILFSEAVLHAYEHGTTDVELAVDTARTETRTIISAAGVIMIVSFSPLLLSNTLLLNQVRQANTQCMSLCWQVGFILIVGVFIDCFVTTFVVIPFWIRYVAYIGYGSVNFYPGRAVKQVAHTPNGSVNFYPGRAVKQVEGVYFF